MRMYIAIVFVLTCISLAHAGQNSMAWDNPTTNTDGILLTDLKQTNIYRSVNSNAWEAYASVAASFTTFADGNLPPGMYCYAVTAVNIAGGESVPSNTLCFQTPQTPMNFHWS